MNKKFVYQVGNNKKIKLNVRKAGFSSPESLRLSLSLGRLTGNFPYSLGILTITLDFYW
jgi:hypothetical protein